MKLDRKKVNFIINTCKFPNCESCKYCDIIPSKLFPNEYMCKILDFLVSMDLYDFNAPRFWKSKHIKEILKTYLIYIVTK